MIYMYNTNPQYWRDKPFLQMYTYWKKKAAKIGFIKEPYGQGLTCLDHTRPIFIAHDMSYLEPFYVMNIIVP